jgi:hypothetical protein
MVLDSIAQLCRDNRIYQNVIENIGKIGDEIDCIDYDESLDDIGYDRSEYCEFFEIFIYTCIDLEKYDLLKSIHNKFMDSEILYSPRTILSSILDKAYEKKNVDIFLFVLENYCGYEEEENIKFYICHKDTINKDSIDFLLSVYLQRKYDDLKYFVLTCYEKDFDIIDYLFERKKYAIVRKIITTSLHDKFMENKSEIRKYCLYGGRKSLVQYRIKVHM